MKNPLKKKLQQGKIATGTFVGLCHPDVAEMLARVGFDWLLLDMEHSPMGFETLQRMMQAMSGTDCVPIVRPQWSDLVGIKRVLDIGAYGVVLPWINTRKEAENAVKACKYPPVGIRGFGPRRAGMFDPSYYKTANDEVMVIPQVETEEALKNLDDILSVPGIDAVYIGPWDLSSCMGLGIPPQWENPRYARAIDRVFEAAHKHGKPAGMYTTMDTIEWALDKGFTFNTLDSADTFLMQSAKKAVEKVQSYKPARQRGAKVKAKK